MGKIKAFVINTIVLGAVSSCTFGCGPLYPANQNQVGANRVLPPADPNQAIIQLMQQKTLEGMIDNWGVQNKCQQKELSCDEMILLYKGKCGGSLVPVKPSPVSYLDYELQS